MSKEPVETHEDEEEDEEDDYESSSRDANTPEINFKALSKDASNLNKSLFWKHLFLTKSASSMIEQLRKSANLSRRKRYWCFSRRSAC